MRTTWTLALLALLAAVALATTACTPSVAEGSQHASDTSTLLMLHPSSGVAADLDGVPAPRFDGDGWAIGTATAPIRFPVPAQVGDTILAWSVHLYRVETGPLGPTTGARLERLDFATGQHEAVGMGATDTTEQTGPIVLTVPIDPPHVVDKGGTLSLMVAGDGWAGDRVVGAAVRVERP